MVKKNIFISVIIFVILLIIIYLFYKYVKGKRKTFLNVLAIDYLLSNERMDIPNCDIKAPIDGVNYAINFYIFIDNFYKNYGNWKHIFHKGTPPSLIGPFDFKYTNMVYDGWCDLVEYVGQQSPGLWLHPNKNTLRLAFTTENKIRDGNSNKFKLNIDNIPEGNNKIVKNEVIEYNDCTNIEYCDIDIEIQVLTHLLFIVRHKSVDIYINGRLAKSKIFLGTIVNNKGSLYLDYNISYDGYIKNFNYSPYHLTSKEISRYNKNKF